ncbi:hypothetical protein [Bradyrhizobium liaoningense]|uniref:hypothetical protein n=1 Tax=Bradyrhizobium liaoningense TaxID=43992 RepID=UPI001BAA76DB|nr:hypothetical protein [Bradyrhizobium liaoningense]MBR1172156.1 hypothetical protein [Bradyrhizobium liaoningense]
MEKSANSVPDVERHRGNEHREVFESCSHNTSFAETCAACVLESRARQPVWEVLPELMRVGKFEREGDGPECAIRLDGSEYELRMLRSNDQGSVDEVQEMMEEAFGREEIDPIEVLKAGIDGKLLDGSRDVARYRFYAARDKSGKIQSIYAGGLLRMIEPALADEAVFMGAYGITRPESRRLGLARELYISSMMQAAADAHSQGRVFSMIVGECTASSERAWNSVGRRRVYVETASNQYYELPYLQPALDFNRETGLPTEGAGAAPEHIMVHFLNGGPDKARISAAIQRMYRWCNTWPQGVFKSEVAYDAHVHYVAKLHEDFNSFMQTNGSLLLLSAKEREQLRAAGTEIIEYTEADHDN